MGALATYHFGHLPVWVEGNAYFNGANVCRHEKNSFIAQGENADVTLLQKDGRVILKTNLYEQLKAFRDGIVTSDTLGCAFEPEQRFENPDGSAIVFDRDYFGAHRGVAALPGPFAEAVNGEIAVL